MLAYLLKLSNYAGVDLEDAYLEKMSINASRHWRHDGQVLEEEDGIGEVPGIVVVHVAGLGALEPRAAEEEELEDVDTIREVERPVRVRIAADVLPTGEDHRLREDDLVGLEESVADPSCRALILCNPHNPVGRSWTGDELRAVAEVCAANGVFVIADEIHADLTLPGHAFAPFAEVAPEGGWAALHGPIKTFGLAGVCDSLLVTSDSSVVDDYRAMSSRLHLTRNQVFSLTAFEAAYTRGGPWVDELLALVQRNHAALVRGLPVEIAVTPLEATYLGWLDLRGLGLEVPEIVDWLGTKARVAMSPGHWFGREGAGFARMTLAVPEDWIAEAIERISSAIA